MIRLNPGPGAGGYAHMFVRSVTARFPPDRDVQGARRALHVAGFRDDQIHVFSGHLGADQIDPGGRLHGRWVRFVRGLEDVLTDEAPVFHRADESTRAGGSVVAVFTAGRDEERRRAADILKAHGGLDTVYWGGWVTEHV